MNRRPLIALAALLCTLTAVLPRPNAAHGQGSGGTVPITPEEVVRGDPSSPRISLIFNVGAGHTVAESSLETLRDRDVRTTFYIMGWWAERNPDALARIAAEGHEIASHGHSVFDLTQVSDAAIIQDLEAADRAISAVTGRTTRPLWNPSAGNRDARVRRVVASIGYRPTFWTIDSFDWQQNASADSVYRRVMDNISNGAIVELHYDSPRTTSSTAATLGRLIDDLRARGYQPVTMTELIVGS
jgi:peptidoglycan/xylan/chitin deacetylase (PgdA/CDA1 family)